MVVLGCDAAAAPGRPPGHLDLLPLLLVVVAQSTALPASAREGIFVLRGRSGLAAVHVIRRFTVTWVGWAWAEDRDNARLITHKIHLNS